MSDSLTHAVAGAAGGVFSTLLTYPLGTISSRISVQKDCNSTKAYNGTCDAFQKIFASEGLPGLYSGLASAIFGISVTNGVYYFWYESVKSYLTSNSSMPLSTISSITAGALAGAATTIITNPIWVINTRMINLGKEQLNSLNAKNGNNDNLKICTAKPSTWSVFFQIIRDDGPASLWQGIVPALILVSNPIIQYTVFEQLKWRTELLIASKGKKLDSSHFFVLGALSKLCATFTTFPYIVIKSRMQLKQSKDDDTHKYNSVKETFLKIMKHEGPAGFYKGLNSKIIQSVLTAAILFAAKEKFYNFSVTLLNITGIKRAAAISGVANAIR